MITPSHIDEAIRTTSLEVSKELYPNNTWTFLEDLLKRHPLPSVAITREEMDSKWVLSEACNGWLLFRMERSVLFGDRKCVSDRYGVLGLGAVDLSCRDLILTEGVSDYVSAKLLFPNTNVLGFTKLGGSVLARSIALSIADNYVICSDNDMGSERNTGFRNAITIREFLRSNGKTASIWLPDVKDLSDTLLNKIRV